MGVGLCDVGVVGVEGVVGHNDRGRLEGCEVGVLLMEMSWKKVGARCLMSVC